MMARYFALAGLVIAALGVLGYRVLGRAPAATAAAVPAAPPIQAHAPAAHAIAEKRTTVIAIAGRVERRVGASWVPLTAGETLAVQDTVRTATGASARIDMGGELVELGDATELTVGELSQTVSSIVLAGGRVSADGKDVGRVIRVETRDSDAVAEAGVGDFDVISSGKGQMTVAARSANVRLSAHGTTVAVRPGEQSSVIAGAPPLAPTKIPASLFLKVNASSASASVATLHGETAPGAIVSINGVRTATAASGAIEAKVPLVAGKNVIVVDVEDAEGRRETKVIERVVHASGPKIDAEVQWK